MKSDLMELTKTLNFKEKINRAIRIINEAIATYGDKIIVAHSLGKDSCVVWDLALKVNRTIKGFIVTTPFKPKETKRFMEDTLHLDQWTNNTKYRLKVFQAPPNSMINPTNPDLCCDYYKVQPTIEALKYFNAKAWITGLRCTEGEIRKDYKEVEDGKKTIKINPILLFTEREIWQYLAVNNIKVNPLYAEGYRSLGCEPCSAIINNKQDERAGRWVGKSKCGGECGIHTRNL